MADLSIQLQPVRNHAEHDATTSEMLPAHHQSTPAGLVPGDEVPEGHQEFSLPPADGGKDAWLFLAACFMLEALVWGKCVVSPLFRGRTKVSSEPESDVLTCYLSLRVPWRFWSLSRLLPHS